MLIFLQIYELIWYAVATAIMLLVVLLLLRTLLNYTDANPFSRHTRIIRSLTDPLVNPVRRGLVRAGLDAKLAPLITILIAILLGYIAVQLVWAVLVITLGGIVESLQRGAIIPLVGYSLYGLLAIYSLMIFMRIVFSWGVSSVNPVLRFLVRATEPVLGPFRRLIPPLGMFDISPIVVLLLIRLFQEAIAGTLLR
ncbi:MAG: YggT family protein [Acidobacteriota bacterium]|jgi:YggT family protein|nr:YggT family protein [Acidobacteriota bacterium]